MKTAILRRISTGDVGTFGKFEVDGEKFTTVELPDRDNAEFVSCIPAGKYRCSWTFSSHFGRMMYQVLDVPGRKGVRFHIGNWAGDKSRGLRCDVEGCILVGNGFGYPEGQQGVTASGSAIERFEEFLNKEDFDLTIIDEYLEAGALPATA